MTPKDIRKQVRNVVQEILPSVLTQEQFKELNKHIDERLKLLEATVKKQMHEMNERHKDTMGYLVRSVSNGPKKEDLK